MIIENTISRPPIVGVPCLTWCPAGPSSRMCWPNSLRRRNSMNLGPARIEIAIAKIPAARTLSTRRRTPREGFRDDLEPDRARALDEHDVAGLDEPGRAFRRLVRIGDPLAPVGTRELPDPEHDVDAELPDQLADLTVVVGRRRSELGHLSENGDLASGVRGEMLERGSHRGRVRVVRVVDQQAAAGQRRLLAAPARELDVDAALGQREPERLHREQGCDRVLSLVPRRERELQLERAARRARRRPGCRLRSPRTTRRSPARSGGSRCRRASGTARAAARLAPRRSRPGEARPRPRTSPWPRSRPSPAARGARARCS